MNTSNRSKKVNLGEMNKESYSLSDVLDHIDCETLSHADWIRVGMAIKHEGGTVQDWDAWSASDPQRYHTGECEKKWASFNGSTNPVTMATLVKLAKDQGWEPDKRIRTEQPIIKRSWNDTVYPDEIDDTPVVDVAFLEDVPMETPGVDWDGRQDLIRYLEALFKPGDYVGYVISTFEKDGRKSPTSGTYSLTAGELIERLKRRDIDMALGEYDREVGGWIRFNPLDGQGAKDQNVTAYRYALVESDKMTIERQAAIYDALELPIAALVHSGNKSLHAIVKVDAQNLDEYKTRVRFLYDICKKNKLEVDNNNKNPSRLSRMPGLMRNGQKQYLVGLDQGKPSWDAWVKHIKGTDGALKLSKIADSGPMPKPIFKNGPIPGSYGLFIGEDGIGKGWVGLDLLLSCTLGRPVNIRTISHCGTPIRVLALCYEDSPPVLKWRLNRICEQAGIDPEEWHQAEQDGRMNIMAEDISPLFEQMPHEVPSPTSFFENLERFITEKKIQLLWIDPLSATAILQSENDNSALNTVAVELRSLAKRTGCTIILVHHTAKAAHGSTHHHASRGGSSLPAASRWQLQLSQESEDKPISMCVSKNSYGRRVFDIRLELNQDMGVIREITGDEIAKSKVSLETAVLNYIGCNPDACINLNAVQNKRGTAAGLVDAVNAPAGEVYQAVLRCIENGTLVTRDEEHNRKPVKILALPIVADKKVQDEDPDEDAEIPFD